MTIRKRRHPTSGYGILPPYSTIEGDYASLREQGVFPYVAMMQVAVADTYQDYVVCRGFDPRILKFVELVSVAKPFGSRVIGKYQIGQVFPAVLPIQGNEEYTPPSPVDVDWRVGQNPGVVTAGSPGGHPDALSDRIEELVDHNGLYVNWLLIDSGTGAVTRRARIVTVSADCTDCDELYEGVWCYIKFLDGPDMTTIHRAFYYDLELDDILVVNDPVSVSWSDYLPEDPGTSDCVGGPNDSDLSGLQEGWLIITWPCPEDSAEMSPVAPNNDGSDFDQSFIEEMFGGPAGGGFNADFNFDYKLHIYSYT